MTETIEGTADEVGTEAVQAGGALVAQQTVGTLEIAPQADAGALVARVDLIRDAMHKAMKQDVDYGAIPGTGGKPTLLKPGAEKLGVLFQLDVQIVNEKVFGPGDHLTVMSKATVYHAPSGTRLGFGEGLCSTREKKYGKRRQERTCPDCGAPAVIKGKAEYGGGWLCWKKRDGCGAKFRDDDPRVTGQDVGDVDNPDVPDTWNTVVKMAEKRARVDAILAVTGASALFTQDAEDLPRQEATHPNVAAAEQALRGPDIIPPSDVTPADAAVPREQPPEYAKRLGSIAKDAIDAGVLTKPEALQALQDVGALVVDNSVTLSAATLAEPVADKLASRLADQVAAVDAA